MAHTTKSQRSFWKWAIALAMALLLGYGLIIKPRWVVVTPLQKQVGLKGGTFKIARLSDLHLSGMGTVEEATLNHLKALQPDVILLTGDVIDDRHALPACLTKPHLQNLAKLPTAWLATHTAAG